MAEQLRWQKKLQVSCDCVRLQVLCMSIHCRVFLIYVAVVASTSAILAVLSIFVVAMHFSHPDQLIIDEKGATPTGAVYVRA